MDRSAGSPDPPYARIVAEIRRRIDTGELTAGERVPSTRQITRDWGVAMATATKVLTALRREGLVRAVPGVGTVVDSAELRPAPAPRTGRRRPSGTAEQVLTRERIVRAAIEVADAEGLSALSMRRVATELGVATMTLYHYLPGKDELVDLMADTVFGEDRLPDPPPPGWRARLELSARLQWQICRRHPWLARTVSLTRPQPWPNAVAHTEWALQAVDGFDLDPATMLYVAITMFNYVRGTAVSLESEVEAERDTGLTDEQWLESQDSGLGRVVTSGRFPVMSRIVADLDFDFTLDLLFEFGLQRMLDGLAAVLATDVNRK